MNTVKKGNLFEEKALEIIENLVENGLFGIKDFLKIQRKPKYYSNLRKAEIEFDLTIEFWPPSSKKPMMTYFIECKDYKKRIPVEQVQKFHSDILQVSGVNAKAVFVSNSPFQKSAQNFADSTGMFVIEGDSVENFKIILHKRTSENENNIPFIKETIDQNTFDDGLRAIGKMIDDQLLSILTKSTKNVSFGIDQLSKDDIKEIAEQELNFLNNSILANGYGLDYKSIENYLIKEYQVKIEHFSPNEDKILGFCDIQEQKIGISKSIIGTQRELFILCHEIGHFILHQKLYINQQLLDSFSDSKLDLSTGRHRLENPRHWIEWQANYFSISFLIPRSSLMAKLWQAQQRRNLPLGNLYLDDQRVNQNSFGQIISYLSNHFNVSKTSLIYRLKEFDLITNNSRTKRIGQIISEYKSQYFA